MNEIHPSDSPLRTIPPLAGAARLRARRHAVELSPRRARSVAEPVGDQPPDPRAGGAVRHQIVHPRHPHGAADAGGRALSRQGFRSACHLAGSLARDDAAAPRRRRRIVDQLAAVLHQRRAAAGAARLQAAPSGADAAHRGHASIRRFQRLARRRRHPLRPRAFRRAEIRAAGRGEGTAGLHAGARQGWTAPPRRLCHAKC